MTTEEKLAEAIIAFEKRWGLRPNGILIHPKLYLRSGLPCTGARDFEGIPIYRSPEAEENQIRFVI